MSLLITTDIECDGCKDWTHGDTGYEIRGRPARAEAARSGWARVKVGSVMADLCPKCQRALKEAEDR